MDIRMQPSLRCSRPHGSQRPHIGPVRLISLPTLLGFILAIPPRGAGEDLSLTRG
jgi:hypothetical protein